MEEKYYLSVFLEPRFFEKNNYKKETTNTIGDFVLTFPMEFMENSAEPMKMQNYNDVLLVLNKQIKEFVRQQYKINDLHMEFEEIGSEGNVFELFESDAFYQIYNQLELDEFDIIKLWKTLLVTNDFLIHNMDILGVFKNEFEIIDPDLLEIYEGTQSYLLGTLYETALTPYDGNLDIYDGLKILNNKDNKIFQLRLLFASANQADTFFTIADIVKDLYSFFEKDNAMLREIAKLDEEMEKLLND